MLRRSNLSRNIGYRYSNQFSKQNVLTSKGSKYINGELFELSNYSFHNMNNSNKLYNNILQKLNIEINNDKIIDKIYQTFNNNIDKNIINIVSSS